MSRRFDTDRFQSDMVVEASHHGHKIPDSAVNEAIRSQGLNPGELDVLDLNGLQRALSNIGYHPSNRPQGGWDYQL